MPVDPQLQPFLDLINGFDGLPLSERDPDTVRGEFALTGAAATVEDVERVEDLTVDGGDGPIAARLYHPGGEGVPLVVWFHGGGWVLGDLDTHNPQCRALCNRLGAAVLAVDYRLAPEHPFPAAVDDAVAAVRWAHAHGVEIGADPDRIVLAGDSAGGNLSAVAAQQLRDEVPIRAQILICAVTDSDLDRASYQENGEGYFLTREAMEWFFGHYVPDDDQRTDPRVAPLRADDLSGLPPAVVITAGYDPLLDEGDAYAEALQAAGVEVRHITYPDEIHGFMGFIGVIDRATQAWGDVVASVRPWLEP